MLGIENRTTPSCSCECARQEVVLVDLPACRCSFLHLRQMGWPQSVQLQVLLEGNIMSCPGSFVTPHMTLCSWFLKNVLMHHGHLHLRFWITIFAKHAKLHPTAWSWSSCAWATIHIWSPCLQWPNINQPLCSKSAHSKSCLAPDPESFPAYLPFTCLISIVLLDFSKSTL